jgi:hypothetical protein
MDFFERVFHISLDGGNGVAEVVVILGIIAIATSTLLRKCLPRNGMASEFIARLSGSETCDHCSRFGTCCRIPSLFLASPAHASRNRVSLVRNTSKRNFLRQESARFVWGYYS